MAPFAERTKSPHDDSLHAEVAARAQEATEQGRLDYHDRIGKMGR
jgi:hypothetical protein